MNGRSDAIIVWSNSRREPGEVDVYRPQSMPGRVVLFCCHLATDEQIVDACVGLLSDVEMAGLFEHLGIQPEEG
jgi:hypothetical protein